MPINCPGGGKPRYRHKGKTRLAFCGNTVVEAKNVETGATHTQAEFVSDRRRQRKRKMGVAGK